MRSVRCRMDPGSCPLAASTGLYLTVKVKIRPIDEDGCRGALQQVWAEAGLSTRPRGRDHPEALAEQLARDPDLLLGAYQDEELVGVVQCTWDGRKGFVNRLAVRPACHGQGVGRALLAACEAALRRRGARIICALVELPNDPSLGLFEQAGYVRHPTIVYLSKRDHPEV